jgi:hypothetical protein
MHAHKERERERERDYDNNTIKALSLNTVILEVKASTYEFC